MLKRRKIAVIGVGAVGKNTAYALCLRGLTDDLVLVDKKIERLRT